MGEEQTMQPGPNDLPNEQNCIYCSATIAAQQLGMDGKHVGPCSQEPEESGGSA